MDEYFIIYNASDGLCLRSRMLDVDGRTGDAIYSSDWLYFDDNDDSVFSMRVIDEVSQICNVLAVGGDISDYYTIDINVSQELISAGLENIWCVPIKYFGVRIHPTVLFTEGYKFIDHARLYFI